MIHETFHIRGEKDPERLPIGSDSRESEGFLQIYPFGGAQRKSTIINRSKGNGRDKK
jgi:hypothetical protein